jgi:2-oxoglutarate dehydrogenase E1 component
MSAEKSLSPNLTFLTSGNAEYISHLYGQFLTNPLKVDESWRGFFQGLNDNESLLLKDLHGASWTPVSRNAGFGAGEVDTMPSVQMPVPAKKPAKAGGSDEDIRKAALDSINAIMMIRAYRARGHLAATLDPLGLKEKAYHSELDPASYGFSESDYDRPIFINGVLGMDTAPLRDILEALHQTYCGHIGVEFLHMSDPAEKAWIQQRIEAPRNQTEFSTDGKKAILQRLTAAETFERFLNTKYQGTKRFGLDGGEAAVPAIEQILKRGGELGLEEVIVGMAHRGRLNILTNVMGKPFTAVFSEFQGNSPNPNDVQGSGDVKYHLGTSSDRDFDGHTVHLSLTANPSHLEYVDPVVVGKVRAKQALRGDTERRKVLPILIHGDAAFAGQGLVAETLMLSELPGYRVGGTIHIVINNQIGFTTMPKYSRSGPYTTDIAKMLSAPIFHVNGDDPEAVVHVARIATEFRQEFKKEVVIDMFCYRRFGHNEGDEPAFTQPLMYKKIKTQATTREQYAAQLVGEGVLTDAEAQAMVDDFQQYLEQAFEATKSYKPNKADFLEGAWTGLKVASGDERRGVTALTDEQFKRVGAALTRVPEDFNLNPKIARQMDSKKAMFEGKEGFDWATGEALAFGTLADQGNSIRLSGQDVGRGTFSQRHAVLYDQDNEEKYLPLQNISAKQGRVEIIDSPLSEEAVLGFEYGYSLADPRTLVMWEAQFGDFVNGAQGIIDEFINSAEAKWLRMSGLVMLLPHGFEGQGPDHSSARPERFLQMCAEDNWQVCNLTTPANYFHALRRQMVRDFRKPLIIMTPKSLLRHKLAVSPAADFTGNSTFHRILPDHDRATLAEPDKIRRVVLCTGKVYYDLLEERRKRDLKDVTIIRVEQLYPFPDKALGEELARAKNADIVWCQEEPRNMGAWGFIHERIEAVLMTIKHKTQRPHYAGRAEAASPATGLMKRHTAEQAALVNEALTV